MLPDIRINRGEIAMSNNLRKTAAYGLRGLTVALILTAVTLAALFAVQPASAEEQKQTATTTNQPVVPDRMKSANRNAEAVRALL
jgi:hypothetical protein